MRCGHTIETRFRLDGQEVRATLSCRAPSHNDEGNHRFQSATQQAVWTDDGEILFSGGQTVFLVGTTYEVIREARR